MRESVSKRLEPLVAFVAGRRGRGELVDVFDLLGRRADAVGRPARAPTDVERDLQQPGELELRLDAALQRTQHIGEGRLRRVLRLLTVAKAAVAEREDALAVFLVQVAGQLGRLGGPGGGGMADERAHRVPPRCVDGMPPPLGADTLFLPTLASSVRVSAGGVGQPRRKTCAALWSRFTAALGAGASKCPALLASAGSGPSVPGEAAEFQSAGGGRAAVAAVERAG